MKLVFFLILGLILGPSGVAVPYPGEYQSAFALAGNVFLLLAGMELSLAQTKRHLNRAFRISIGAFVFPFLAGLVSASVILDFSVQVNMTTWIFLAIAMSVSALPVAIQFLRDIGMYGTDVGRTIIAAATICDILAWIGFSFLLPSASRHEWLVSHLPVILFFVGLLLSDRPTMNTVFAHKVQKVLIGICTPIFFIGLGWKVNLWQNFNFLQIIQILIFASASKFLGTYFAAKWAGSSKHDSMLSALSLNARGAMEILIASVAYQQNIIDATLFTSLIALAIITSLILEPVAMIFNLKAQKAT